MQQKRSVPLTGTLPWNNNQLGRFIWQEVGCDAT
jgi:hypothetical protein